ncbi:carboxypeptidase-like regulatory domain-containing protein [Aureibaculum conchae]|uniref:carboxypeptidase-like regulatory domain-containing protein n=1 Tax=Aureibaculum sp. 2308TA14-22 TaxID=3108392 RepID=UPI003398E77F
MKLKIIFINFSFIILYVSILFPSIIHSFNYELENNIIRVKDTLDLNKMELSEINGKIIDTETNETIPFCHIVVKENSYATASNEIGEFSIKVESFPATIVISHLSYATREIKVENTNSLIIELKPLQNQLNEVIITNTNSKKAIDIVNSAINKYESSNSSANYGRSLYRQKSKNDDEFSEFAEIIYDVKFDNDGIIDWDIFEGRYALKKETINNKNFTLLSKILRVYQPNSDDLIFPLIRGFAKYYTVKIINIINTKNGELVTVSFTPLNKIKTPIIEANVTINKALNDVIKVEGSLKNDKIKIVTLKDKDAVKKNYKLNFEISYREDDSFGLVLDYINLNHEFDYYKENKLLTHLYATSNLSFFEYYDENPKTKTKKRTRFKYRSSDWDKLDAVGYNKSFWENNPIVKRTETENVLIENFEDLRAFESVFMNSEDQISITGSDISNDPFILKVNEDVTKHYSSSLTQKVFLHTDKNSYTKENKIYYSAYVTSENADSTFNDKDVLHIDIVNKGKIVDTKTIKINNGRGSGVFNLSNSINPGNYKVVAYTNFMKNFDPNSFFVKDIKIYNPAEKVQHLKSDKIILDFYPEGGNLINGISNKVAYKAEDSYGNFSAIEGKIIDSDGNFIATTKSKYKGLGFFYLKPQNGKSYSIVLDDNSKYDIPKSLNSGYSLMVNNINPRTISVDIRASEDLKSNIIYILGFMDNKKYYQGSFASGAKDLINFEIPKSKLPSGIMQLVLLDASKKVIGNRSVYINNDDNINISAEIDKVYVDNEFIKLKIKATSNEALASDISLSITKQQSNENLNDYNDDNLISRFKLSSFPNEYGLTKFINKTDRPSNYKLDLMMSINNQSDFSWLEGNLNYPVKIYQHEKRIDVSGIAKDNKGNLLTDTKIKLLTKSKERIWNYEAKTDKNGVFVINDFEEVDSTSLEFRTYNLKNQQIYSKISLIEKEKFNYLDKLNFDEKGRSSLTNNNVMINSNSAFSKEGEILEDVELKAKVKKENPRKSYLVTNPDGIIEGESINSGSNLFRELSNIPGVKYVSDHYIDGGESISIRNSDEPPLWILDGMKISGPEAVNVKDLERVEVVVSLSKSAVFGPEGVNGVVLFYSKEGVDSKFNNDIKTSSFNKVIYNSSTPFEYKNDDTLYWNPQIATDQNGFKELLIKKPDATIKYINVNIQAINKNGEIGYLNKVLKL